MNVSIVFFKRYRPHIKNEYIVLNAARTFHSILI